MYVQCECQSFFALPSYVALTAVRPMIPLYDAAALLLQIAPAVRFLQPAERGAVHVPRTCGRRSFPYLACHIMQIHIYVKATSRGAAIVFRRRIKV